MPNTKGEQKEDEDGALHNLPDQCLIHACSFLCPKDIAWLGSVSKILQSVAECDAVWREALESRSWQRITRRDRFSKFGARLSYARAIRREWSPLVFDLGSRTLRGGFANEAVPLVQLERGPTDEVGDAMQRLLMAFDFFMRGTSTLVSVVVPCFLPSNPTKLSDIQKFAAEVLRACHNFGGVAAVRFESASVCALRSHGVPLGGDGIVVHCGWRGTHATAVVAGSAHMPPEKLVKRGTFANPLGGRDLTTFCRLLLERRMDLPVPSDNGAAEVARCLKEAACFVRAARTKWEPTDAEMTLFELPVELSGGHTIVMQAERYLVGEALFDVTLLSSLFASCDNTPHNTKLQGLHELCHNAADSALSSTLAHTTGKRLFSHIVVEGGGLALKGVRQRLQRELGRRAPTGCRVKVLSPEQNSSVWFDALPELMNKSCFDVETGLRKECPTEERGAVEGYTLACWRGAALLTAEATCGYSDWESLSTEKSVQSERGGRSYCGSIFSRWCWLDEYEEVGSSVLWQRQSRLEATNRK